MKFPYSLVTTVAVLFCGCGDPKGLTPTQQASGEVAAPAASNPAQQKNARTTDLPAQLDQVPAQPQDSETQPTSDPLETVPPATTPKVETAPDVESSVPAAQAVTPPNGAKLLHELEGHSSDVHSLAFSPNGKVLLSGAVGVIKLWDVATGQETKEVNAHENSLVGLKFSPDGSRLVSSSRQELRIWDFPGMQQLQTLTEPATRVIGFAVSPDGRLIASSHTDRQIRLWDLATGRPRAALKTQAPSSILEFSPDNQVLAAVTGQTVRLFDLKANREIAALDGHNGQIVSLGFSPDGQLLASGSWFGHTILWDAIHHRQIAELDTTTSQGDYVAFTPDGQTLITAGPKTGYSAVAKIWDVPTRQTRATFDPGQGLIWASAISSDGKLLALNSGKTVKLWELVHAGPEDVPPLEFNESSTLYGNSLLIVRRELITQQGFIHPAVLDAARDRQIVDVSSTVDTFTDQCVGQIAEQPWAGRVTKFLILDGRLTDASLPNLSSLKSLQQLRLDNCPHITDAGLASLAQLSQLKWLRLSETPIGDAGLPHLAKLKGLESLALGSTDVTDAGVAHLKALTSLTHLELRHCPITDKALEHLGTMQALKELDLEKTKIGDAGLAHLASLDGLVELTLSDTAVTDAGLAHLAPLKQLKTLELRYLKITDAGLQHLQVLKNLTQLNLYDSDATYEGVQRLKQVLPELEVDGTPSPKQE